MNDVMDGWESEHDVTAADIRSALLELRGQEGDPCGLQIRGAVVVGRLDLDGLATEVPLSMVGCDLTEGLTAEEASLPHLTVARCRLTAVGDSGPALNLQAAEVHGSLRLNNSRLTAGKCFALQAGGLRVRSGAYLDAIYATVQSGASVFLNNAWIGVGLTLQSAILEGGLSLAGAHIDGSLHLQSIQVNGRLGPAIAGDGLRVEGAAFLNEGFRATSESQECGTIHFVGARFGQFNLQEASISNTHGVALVGEHMEVRTGTRLFNISLLGAGDYRGVIRLNSANLGGSILNLNRLGRGTWRLGDRGDAILPAPTEY